VAFLLALSATSDATTVKQYKPKAHAGCRAHYVKRVETVREHKHGKVVKLKETWCVYVAPKATPKPVTTTTTPVTTTTTTSTTSTNTIPAAPAPTSLNLSVTSVPSSGPAEWLLSGTVDGPYGQPLDLTDLTISYTVLDPTGATVYSFSAESGSSCDLIGAFSGEQYVFTGCGGSGTGSDLEYSTYAVEASFAGVVGSYASSSNTASFHP
jgi:hypothetical protein